MSERRCRKCWCKMAPSRGRNVLRSVPVPAGFRRHEGRGLCERCYDWVRAAGLLEDYPRLTRPPARPFDACTLDEGEAL